MKDKLYLVFHLVNHLGECGKRRTEIFCHCCPGGSLRSSARRREREGDEGRRGVNVKKGGKKREEVPMNEI